MAARVGDIQRQLLRALRAPTNLDRLRRNLELARLHRQHRVVVDDALRDAEVVHLVMLLGSGLANLETVDRDLTGRFSAGPGDSDLQPDSFSDRDFGIT